VDFYYLKDDKCGKDVEMNIAAVDPSDKSLKSKSTERVGPIFEQLRQRDRDAEVEIDVIGRFYFADKPSSVPAFAILDIIDAKPTGKSFVTTRR
jgi:hypothetical protein